MIETLNVQTKKALEGLASSALDFSLGSRLGGEPHKCRLVIANLENDGKTSEGRGTTLPSNTNTS